MLLVCHWCWLLACLRKFELQFQKHVLWCCSCCCCCQCLLVDRFQSFWLIHRLLLMLLHLHNALQSCFLMNI
jgi:diacylglycerol kinase